MSISIRFTGSGGQGAVLAGIIIARAVVLYDKKHATEKDGKFAIQTQSYGPEVRGSVTKSDIKISDEEIHYPYVKIPDIFIAMSEQAYNKYSKEIGNNTTVLIDKDLVKIIPEVKYYEIPANKIAKELGKEVVANIVMIGALCGITNVTSKKSLESAVLEIVPKGTEDINKKALQKGYSLGKKLKNQYHNQ